MRHAHIGKGIVHEVVAVAWAFDPAFDGCVGGGGGRMRYPERCHPRDRTKRPGSRALHERLIH